MPVTVLQAPPALALTAGSLVLLCSASKSPLRSLISHIQSFFFLKFPVTIDPLAMQSCFFPLHIVPPSVLGQSGGIYPVPFKNNNEMQ